MLVHLVRTNTKDMDGACTLISMDGLIHGPGAVLDATNVHGNVTNVEMYHARNGVQYMIHVGIL